MVPCRAWRHPRNRGYNIFHLPISVTNDTNASERHARGRRHPALETLQILRTGDTLHSRHSALETLCTGDTGDTLHPRHSTLETLETLHNRDTLHLPLAMAFPLFFLARPLLGLGIISKNTS